MFIVGAGPSHSIRLRTILTGTLALFLLCFPSVPSAGQAHSDHSTDVPSLLVQMRTLVESLPDGPGKFDLYEELGEIQAKAGKIEDAKISLSRIPTGYRGDYLSDKLKKEIALSLAKANDFIGALNVADSIPNFDRGNNLERDFAKEGIAVAMAKSGDVEGALRIVDDLKEKTWAKTNALIAIGEYQADRGDLHGGMQMAAQAADHSPYALWGIAKEQVKAGQVDEFMGEVQKLSEPLAKQYAMWGVVGAYLAEKNLSAAIQFAQHIPKGHASASAWRDIALSQIETGNHQAGLASLRKALAGAKVIQNSFARSDIYWRIAEGLAKARDYQKALQTVDLIEFEGHRHSALRDIVAELSRVGEVDQALRIAAQFNKEFAFPSPYWSILQDLAASGQVDKALKLVVTNNIRLEETSPYEPIALGQAQRGDGKGALETLEKISKGKSRDLQDKNYSLERIARCQIEKNDLEGAEHTVLMLPKNWRALPIEELTVALTRKGRFEKAKNILQGFSDTPVTGKATQAVAHVLTARGDGSTALTWGNSLSSPYLKANILLGVLQAKLQSLPE